MFKVLMFLFILEIVILKNDLCFICILLYEMIEIFVFNI